jgi:hypothetical protein
MDSASTEPTPTENSGFFREDKLLPQNELFLPPDSINYDVFGPAFYKVPNGKVVIFGLPKCGNAWLQSMLVKYFDTNPVLTLDEEQKSGILSIHDPFEPYMLKRKDFANGVCLIRDMRDLVVSYYYFGLTGEWRKAMTRFFYEDMDSFYYEWFLSRCVQAHRMFSFAEDFASRGVPVIRYERLNADPIGELSRLIARWGIVPEINRVGQIVNDHHLSKLKKTGLNLGYKVEKSHFRKGGWGNFLNEMPPHIVDDITERFGSFLKRWGYPTDLSETNIAAYCATLDSLHNTPPAVGE